MTQAGVESAPPPDSEWQIQNQLLRYPSLTMANLLKKPLKLALVQLATGPPPPTPHVIPANTLPQQAPTNPPTSPAPAPKSSKLLNMAQTSSSSPNASTPPTEPSSFPPTLKPFFRLPPPRSNLPHITPFPPWPPKQAPIYSGAAFPNTSPRRKNTTTHPYYSDPKAN